ncbi:hypothetical protein [Lentisalinibacter salinarum]|uniref:hypothetical protein n=1 Tax=Lentisalinibacter salinarum TaxID=2992239 RepID=UPI00386E6F01
MAEEKDDTGSILRSAVKRESLLAAVLVLGGVLLLPAAVYGVGFLIFGEYPGGLRGFYGEIWGALGRGNPSTWFLVLSPWVVVTVARLTWRAMRRPRSRTPA